MSQRRPFVLPPSECPEWVASRRRPATGEFHRLNGGNRPEVVIATPRTSGPSFVRLMPSARAVCTGVLALRRRGALAPALAAHKPLAVLEHGPTHNRRTVDLATDVFHALTRTAQHSSLPRPLRTALVGARTPDGAIVVSLTASPTAVDLTICVRGAVRGCGGRQQPEDCQ